MHDSEPNAALVLELDRLRADLGCKRAATVEELASRIQNINQLLLECDQDEALAAAAEASLAPSHCLPLLRRATLEDPDERSGLATAAADLMSSLSGQGRHTHRFATEKVVLKLRHQPQATGTAGAIWRGERIAAVACESGFGGLAVTGKSVVELACGTGGAGCVCAALGASVVWLTDVDIGGMALARANVELNELSDRVRVRKFDVHDPLGAAEQVSHSASSPPDDGDPSCSSSRGRGGGGGGGGGSSSACDWPEGPGAPPRFGLVLASDIPYDFVSPAKLVDAVALLLAPTADARALVVQCLDPRRSDAHQQGVRESFALAQQHPELECVATEERTVIDDEGAEDVEVQLWLHVYVSRGRKVRN
jgi:predicted nicotinamide N-methyase